MTTHENPNPGPKSELLTAPEVGRRLRVSAETVRTWARNGAIPSVRINPKVIRFDMEQVIVALRAGSAGEGGPCHG